MNYQQEQMYHIAWNEVLKTLEDITITNEWILNHRLTKIGINNYPINDTIKDKLSSNKIQYEQLREQRRKKSM